MNGDIASISNRIDNRTFYIIADDLTAYIENELMLKAQIAEGVSEEERVELAEQLREVTEHIKRLTEELLKKTDNVAHVIRHIADGRELVHRERDRLKTKEQAYEHAEKWLRDYTVSVMRQNNMKRIKTPMNTLFLRDTEAVEVTDATALDPQYLNAEIKLPYALWREIIAILQQVAPQSLLSEATQARVKTEPVLTAIRQAIKAGEDVEGADLRLNTHLVLR